MNMTSDAGGGDSRLRGNDGRGCGNDGMGAGYLRHDKSRGPPTFLEASVHVRVGAAALTSVNSALACR